ncbi:hypothetical protein MTR67_033858 [Solanum verrucosum]|uniref:Uncharacterized protein n=1 Tax=Solanum verrucosum TaxID=315347 RepID=A0AAF0ZJP2_SOLVR|nr:hypothetical protein MTR67_033858 [Solanum verrucosum]
MSHYYMGKKKITQASFRKSCMRGKGDLENASCTDKGVLHHTSANWGAEIHEPNYSPRLWHGSPLPDVQPFLKLV